jgi:6-phosphogluconolactonase (cycloisomerase 2 family)
MFRVHGAVLQLLQVVPIDGSQPVAVAQHGSLVYVLNAGGSSAVVGFAVSHNGLARIPNSRRFLSTNTSGPGALAFSPDGQFLAVVERLTNNIDVFTVHADGTLSAIKINPDSDPGAFAVSFAPNGALLMAETGPAGVNNGSTVSSWAVESNGTLTPISTNVGTDGNANCWNAVTPDGRFVYDSNAGSSNIAGFSIGANGSLTPLSGTIAGSNPAGSGNLDITISSDGKFLYTLNSRGGTIGIFAIQPDGTLNNISEAGGITALAGFNGIAAN